MLLFCIKSKLSLPFIEVFDGEVIGQQCVDIVCSHGD